MTLVWFIIILAVLVLIHEFGHFIAAKRSGVLVEEFGFGFPPKLFGVRYRGTLYSFNAIPFGGFVKLKGVPGEDAHPEHFDDHNSFAKKAFLQKFFILSGGVFMNILLAVMLFAVGFTIGMPQVLDKSNLFSAARIRDEFIQIVETEPTLSAAQAGIQAGDTLLTLDGQVVRSIEEVQEYNAERIGQTVAVQVRRGDETLTFPVNVSALENEERGVLGVQLARVGTVSYPWYLSFGFGIVYALQILWLILGAFATLLIDLITSGQVSADLSGPVGIAAMTGQVAKLGFVYVLQFVALLSLNLALFNILPIPALDGGRIFFLIIEKLRRKKNSERVENVVHRIGFALLLVLIVLVTFRDLHRYSDSIKAFFSGIF
ncbi:MAG: RIP metalloprotease RseP [Candidatus Kerfeldbacteria bacterium RIFCSPHIGHO2_02_FULL_42_14]|uniref:Zinc metalloprotease n=1 Tax=Candidatus Kerfeldbacteria bacterium RIFCSPHIGHO2_02_FULL_42_14 TaxID=1798540 RepID=A0A1G2AQ13_9BACT|nr:MAG: RIP metalloprotease RseP [Candidatus Kerfeldbacteria bacterium RIFCSPHIGHO2_02_FULL_42_14]OGY82577.1 MAG: RIP metalloprotease RseP [Candidatus Kerfeldbacteria bacterium RIFCSPLOWO2_02_FULL_42_19]OGY85180.1 MAG: RIP metalloprotease RseP [Candidatus Kerfeldbacteria bacterium RIFCSPLOWO2_12_FULL_43_9]